MINIQDKSNCCGCSACVQRCPKQCISLHEDEEGFLYPRVDEGICIDCGLCEKVCPVLHQVEEQVPIEVLAAKNPNERIRLESSSGGIFTLLAEQTIDAGGVVFGVKWNEHFEAVHAYTETKEGLAVFRGSKYVQSQVGETFKQAEQFLKEGRQVLYSGTPCQIAALKLFLRKDYENLLAVDFICHGVPSPGIFRWYLNEELLRYRYPITYFFRVSQRKLFMQKNDEYASELHLAIKDILFRDKQFGWKKFSFVLLLQDSDRNKRMKDVRISYSLKKHSFLRGFLRNLYLRQSCHSCPAKSGKSCSDITLADYWKIHTLKSDIDDDKGVSALCINTQRGVDFLHSITMESYLTSYEDLCVRNPSMLKSCECSYLRTIFFKSLSSFHVRVTRIYYRWLMQLVKDVLFAYLRKFKLVCKK